MIILRQKEYGKLGSALPGPVKISETNPGSFYSPSVMNAKNQLRDNGIGALQRSINTKGSGSMKNPLVKDNLKNGIRYDKALGY